MNDIALLGPFEEIVLLSLIRLRDEAYGMRIRRDVEARSGRSISIGAVYSALDRLEAKGYLVLSEASGGEVRRGRARRFFRLSRQGARALIHGRELRERVWDGLDVAELLEQGKTSR